MEDGDAAPAPMAERRRRRASANPVLFHPDYTVGFGFTPNLLTLPKKALAGFGAETPSTAGGELHPALRTRRRNWRQHAK